MIQRQIADNLVKERARLVDFVDCLGMQHFQVCLVRQIFRRLRTAAKSGYAIANPTYLI